MTADAAAQPAAFDRLARVYRTMERLAFGADLERARFQHLERLRGCRDILILGEGDGRCLARVVQIAPQARIHCVDASAVMLARARRRLADDASLASSLSRVHFEQADARVVSLRERAYDAIITCFFLDCFVDADVERIVARVDGALRPGAEWLYADFALPPGGWPRRRARLWLRAMYAFFRWQTGIEARELPASERILARADWREVGASEWRGGFIRSAVYRRADAL